MKNLLKNKKVVNLLGVNISTLNNLGVEDILNNYLKDGRQHQVVTANPEFLLTADRNDGFFVILSKADLIVADGIGLKFASWLYYKNVKRYAGSDLLKYILNLAEKKKYKVGVVNWSKGLSTTKDISTSLNSLYPELKYNIFNLDRKNSYENCNINDIKEFAPDIVFCTLGAPYQENFIFHNIKRIPSIKIGIGIGGGIDFLTNKVKRAPKIVRVFGFEWIWRLFVKPNVKNTKKIKRGKRIYNAFFVFVFKILRNRFLNPFLYRKNVVGFLFRGDEVLIVNSNSRVEDYWTLPQGGVNGGEIRERALFREMMEEVGTNNFKIVANYVNIYKYKWTYKPRLRGFKGQKQSLFILNFQGDKKDIKISLEHKGFKWIKISNLVKEADEWKKESYKLFLEKYKEIIK